MQVSRSIRWWEELAVVFGGFYFLSEIKVMWLAERKWEEKSFWKREAAKGNWKIVFWVANVVGLSVSFVVTNEKKTSQPVLLFPSMFQCKHRAGRECNITRVGVLKQHRIEERRVRELRVSTKEWLQWRTVESKLGK